MNRLTYWLFFFVMLTFSQKSSAQNNILDSISLDKIISNSPVEIDYEKNKIQVIVASVINPKKHSQEIKYTSFRLDAEKYFYPASCVKLPVILLALEWLNEHKRDGIKINSEFELFSSYSCHSFKSVSTDKDDLLTIENCIKKILLVSDNRSYNSLFDLLGRDYIYDKLKEKGFTKTQIVKSFSGCNDSILNFKPFVRFYNNSREIIFENDSIAYSTPIHKLEFNAVVGDSIMLDSINVIAGGKDFSSGNYLPLNEGIEMLVRLLYPTNINKWKITEKQRSLVLSWMSKYPRESKMKMYSSNPDYFDAYKKYLVYGRDSAAIKIDSLRIYNVVGLAYGFATDIAFIKSGKSSTAFFIAATTYSNSDGVLNDNKYDYQTIGFPFLKYLGKEIYSWNRSNKK